MKRIVELSWDGLPQTLDIEVNLESPKALVGSVNEQTRASLTLYKVERWKPESRHRARIKCICNKMNICKWIYVTDKPEETK